MFFPADAQSHKVPTNGPQPDFECNLHCLSNRIRSRGSKCPPWARRPKVDRKVRGLNYRNPSERPLENAVSFVREFLRSEYSTPQYDTIQYNTIQHNSIQYSTIQYTTKQHEITQYSTIQCRTIQHCVYSTVLCTTVEPANGPSLSRAGCVVDAGSLSLSLYPHSLLS